MKTFINILVISLAISLEISLICCLLSLIPKQPTSKYASSSGWNCEEDFYSNYYPQIEEKLSELQEKYSLHCEKNVEQRTEQAIYICMYTDIYTFEFLFTSHDQHGSYSGALYFYGENEKQLYDYNLQKNLVDFLSDFTHFIAYGVDTDVNTFEEMYNYCMTHSIDGYRQQLHFDPQVDSVEYGISLKNEHKDNYYKGKKVDISDLKANYYYFNGLIKGNLE